MRFVFFVALILIGSTCGEATSQASNSGTLAAIKSASMRDVIVDDFIRAVVEKWLKRKDKPAAAEISRGILFSAERYELDPLLLLAMIIQESSVRPNVRGRHGEIGLMQLKLSTARWIAKIRDLEPPSEKTLFKPAINIEFGAAYLSYLRELVGQERFIQAYNSGPSGMRRKKSDYRDRIAKHYDALIRAFEVTDMHSFASLVPDDNSTR